MALIRALDSVQLAEWSHLAVDSQSPASEESPASPHSSAATAHLQNGDERFHVRLADAIHSKRKAPLPPFPLPPPKWNSSADDFGNAIICNASNRSEKVNYHLINPNKIQMRARGEGGGGGEL